MTSLVLPSAGRDPLPLDTAVAAVLGYARGRRPLHYRAPNARTGRWVELPAFGYERFDVRPRAEGPLGEADILAAEGLHGRLDPDAWAALKSRLTDVAPLLDAVVDRADGRRLEQLEDDEFSVLTEPGTVGALLRQLGTDEHLRASLHHRRPDLVPLLVRTTRWALLHHVREGDSGVEAVIHRELTQNADGFAALQHAVQQHGVELTALRLHDVLLWLSAGLRLTHAVALGQQRPR